VPCGLTLQRGAVDGRGQDFVAAQVGRAHLHAGGAQGQRGTDTRRVGDAVGRDHRDLHRGYDLR